MTSHETIYETLKRQGISRREFLKLSGTVAAVLSLPINDGLRVLDLDEIKPAPTLTQQVRRALETKPRLPVIWLQFQDCAGCTEALSRSQSPTLVNLVLNSLSIEYQETLMVAAGSRAEAAKRAAMEKYIGEYVLVVEGSISSKDGGVYCTVGGRASDMLLREAAEGAAAIIALGNCASYGGLPAAFPSPSGGMGVRAALANMAANDAETISGIEGVPVINLPGCPGIPEVYTNTIVHYLVFGSLPELDELGRPRAFYGATVHDRCLRRHFSYQGLFAESFNDDGHRNGYCLYKLGCKGPTTYNACPSMRWMSGLSFPIQSGHPCLGCSQPDFWDAGGFY